jgi:hypothetical protein
VIFFLHHVFAAVRVMLRATDLVSDALATAPILRRVVGMVQAETRLCLRWNLDCARWGTPQHHSPAVPNVGSVQHGIMRSIVVTLASCWGGNENSLPMVWIVTIIHPRAVMMTTILPSAILATPPTGTKDVRNVIVILSLGNFGFLCRKQRFSDVGLGSDGRGRRERAQRAHGFAFGSVVQLAPPCSILVV